jgi:hypothetical protein
MLPEDGPASSSWLKVCKEGLTPVGLGGLVRGVRPLTA